MATEILQLRVSPAKKFSLITGTLHFIKERNEVLHLQIGSNNSIQFDVIFQGI